MSADIVHQCIVVLGQKVSSLAQDAHREIVQHEAERESIQWDLKLDQ